MGLENKIEDTEINDYIKKLLMMAMGFFVLTTLIGLINVLDFADDALSRGILLFHLHAGTIAWISTGIACALIWLFSQNREITEEYKDKIGKFYMYWQIVIPTYAIVILISFHFQFYFLLPIFALLTIGGFLWAAYIAYSEKQNIDNFGVPHLSFIIGLAIAGYAGFIGSLLGIQYTIGNVFLPGDGIGGHASAMEIGYVFIIITGMVEMFLKGDEVKPLDNLGISQPIILMFSAISSSLGILLNISPLVQLSLPLEIIGVLIFFIRMGPELIKPEHMKDPSSRYFVTAPVFLLVAVILFVYILVKFFIPGVEDPYVVELLLALNHSELVGAASGSLFGMITAFTIDNREGNLEWADSVGFALLYIGLIGFIMGFILEFALHSAIFMGIGILILITTFFMRLTKN